MKNTIIIGKIDLSIFDKPKKVNSPSLSIVEGQEMHDDDFQTELDQEDYYDSLHDDDDDTSFLGEFAYQITDPKF